MSPATSQTLAPIQIEGESAVEAATGPVEGYVAERVRSVLRYVGGAVPELRGNVASRYDQIKLRRFEPDQYLDGLRLPTYFYTLPKVDPYLLERVEVIKGPASVLYALRRPAA